MKRYTSILTLLVVAALGAVLLVVDIMTAPSIAAPAPVGAERAYAGRSAGNEVTVAVAAKGGRAVAYLCDGTTVEAWLEGTLVGDQLDLKGAQGATLTGSVTEAAALGSVSVDGKQRPYSAQGVPAPAGIYAGRATCEA